MKFSHSITTLGIFLSEFWDFCFFHQGHSAVCPEISDKQAEITDL